MSVNSPSPSVISATFEEYRRYERYLAVAYMIVFVTVVSMLCPRSLWGACLGVIATVALSFRKYHLAVHRFVGCPGPESDKQVQLWGTAAQAVTWASMPLTVAACMVQLAS